jgi:hypothetical protein
MQGGRLRSQRRFLRLPDESPSTLAAAVAEQVVIPQGLPGRFLYGDHRVLFQGFFQRETGLGKEHRELAEGFRRGLAKSRGRIVAQGRHQRRQYIGMNARVGLS